MNPYIILGFVLSLIVAGAAGFTSGHHFGVNGQKAADQVQFDKINQDIADRKAQANAIYRKNQDDNLALMVERDQLKTTLEKEHANHQAATTALRDKYSGLGLRFTAEAPRLGNGGGCAQSAGTDPAGSDSAAIIQLPGAIAADLRRLAFDADQLADDYQKCYGYAEQVR